MNVTDPNAWPAEIKELELQTNILWLNVMRWCGIIKYWIFKDDAAKNNSILLSVCKMVHSSINKWLSCEMGELIKSNNIIEL